MAKNSSLNKASKAKEDEFYTKLTDIEKELRHYKDYFKDKTVFCNCDDPKTSNFWKFFALNFVHLGLKKLVATHFEKTKPSYKLELSTDINEDKKINEDDAIETPLRQNGDYRSPECIEILKNSDVVVTNPPFSLFRDYVAQLIEHEKDFILIGSQNALTYNEIFPLLRDNKVWLGYNSGDMEFIVPDYYKPRAIRYREEGGIKYRSMGNICWYTNVDIQKRHEKLILYKKYYGNETEYPTYDNYNAINVNRVKDIPADYYGVMGVPITFMEKFNPDQFEIVGNEKTLGIDKGRGYINGKRLYGRVFIRQKEES